jgi:uncharacterized protein YbaR (Trm112 family)
VRFGILEAVRKGRSGNSSLPAAGEGPFPGIREAERMIDKELLNILVCPEDHTPLDVADEELVARLNRAITAGQIKNRGGQRLRKTIQGGLVRQDQTLLYPIVDNIPVLLVDDAVPLDQVQ